MPTCNAVGGVCLYTGFQYGSLVAEEIAEYAKKLGIQENPKDGPGAWAEMRFFADAATQSAMTGLPVRL